MSRTGGCLCGKVRYEIQGEPMMAMICHCRNCQKQSGAAYSVNLVVAEAQLALEGSLSTFNDSAESGNAVYRQFCGICGSPVYSGLEAAPGIIALKVGTLDDPADITPAIEAWCERRLPWLADQQQRVEFPENPPAGG